MFRLTNLKEMEQSDLIQTIYQKGFQQHISDKISVADDSDAGGSVNVKVLTEQGTLRERNS